METVTPTQIAFKNNMAKKLKIKIGSEKISKGSIFASNASLKTPA